jgi:hypothetical protein
MPSDGDSDGTDDDDVSDVFEGIAALKTELKNLKKESRALQKREARWKSESAELKQLRLLAFAPDSEGIVSLKAQENEVTVPCARSAFDDNEQLKDMASAAEGTVELPTDSVCAVRLVVMALTCPAKAFKQALKKRSACEVADFLLVGDQLNLKMVVWAASALTKVVEDLDELWHIDVFSAACNQHTASGNDGDKEVWALLCTSIADAISDSVVTKCWYNRLQHLERKRNKTSLYMYPAVFEQLGFKIAALNPVMKNPDFLNAITSLSAHHVMELIKLMPQERIENTQPESHEWEVSVEEGDLDIWASKIFQTKTEQVHGDRNPFDLQARIEKEEDGSLWIGLQVSNSENRAIAMSVCSEVEHGPTSESEAIVRSEVNPSCVNVYHEEVHWLYPADMQLEEARTAHGLLRGRTTVQLVESTVQRDILEAWALGHGLAAGTARPTIWELLTFFSTPPHGAESWAAAIEALLLHAAAAFGSEPLAEVATLPLAVFRKLVSRSDLAAASEMHVVSAVVPWANAHTTEEMLQLLPSLRLAWIPVHELKGVLELPMLHQLKGHPQLAQQVDEALRSQVQVHQQKRKRENETLVGADLSSEHPEFFCPISLELMKDPVMVADGHTYDRLNIVKWLATNDTCPKTGARLSHKKIVPNHSIKSMVQEHLQRKEELSRRLTKRRRFVEDQVPASSYFTILTGAKMA